MIEYLEPESMSACKDVVVQGDPADFFYVIKEGKCTVLSGTNHVGTLQPGDSFGETGLLYNAVRNATVRTDEFSVLWKLDRNTFRRQLAKMHVSYSSSIESTLRSANILQSLCKGKMNKLIEAAVQVQYTKDQVIIKKGETGRLGYFVMEGTIRVTDLPNGIPDMTFGPGDHFGLQALFTDDPRMATVVADSKVSAVALCSSDIGELLGDIKELFLGEEEIRRLKSVPLLSEFSGEMLSSLATNMERKKFRKGEHIIHQGEIGTIFYLIESGECDVIHNDEKGIGTVVNTLGQLDYFGEMGLLKGEPRNADVVASTDCELLEVGQATFRRIFGSSSSFSRQLNEVVKGRDKALKLVKSPPEKITKEQLVLVKMLGKGTFGTVNLVKDRKTGLFYAVKEMSIEFIERNRQEDNIVGEKEAMQLCDHPFILKLYTVFKDRCTLSFLVEFCNGGEMFDIIHKSANNCLPESQVCTSRRSYATLVWGRRS
jgi:cGMP-dependent protein kinase